MKLSFKNFFLVLAMLAAMPAWTANDQTTDVTLNTREDDLRAGGVVTFIFRMNDGKDQQTVLVSNERLPDNHGKRFQVAPKPPYDWSDVVQVGLSVKPHPGDGALLQADQWKVWFNMNGIGGNCNAETMQPGTACFPGVGGQFHFTGNDTKWFPLRMTLGLCDGDADCGSIADFCAPRAQRCDRRARNADGMGCVRLATATPACGTGQTCLAAEKRCAVAGCENPDADNDGENSVQCGGNDCDDNDARRAPSRTEVCDAAGVDEDCVITTVGTRDQDNDGFVDAACWNDGLPKSR